MPVCIAEAKPGGNISYEWTNGKGAGFHLTGEYVDLEPYSRIAHVERMRACRTPRRTTTLRPGLSRTAREL